MVKPIINQQLEEIRDAILGLPTSGVQEAVDEWLDEHPEATTTVQDGSLTYKKLVNGTLGFVAPEMYGAVGDGVTDDSAAITACITAAGIGGKIMLVADSVYNVGASGFILLNNQVLTGGGTLLQTGDAASTIITTAEGVTIDGINIKQLNHHTGIAVRTVGDNVTINDCTIIGKRIGVFGDNVYGNNLIINKNRISFTEYGIYESVGSSEQRRTGLKIINNNVYLAAVDTNLDVLANKACCIGGCSGAVVRGNTFVGAAMDFASYLWTDHTIYDGNVSDNYVSMIGDYSIVTNNIIDTEMRPAVYFPVTREGMKCALEVVGNGINVVGNIIRNFESVAISLVATAFTTYKHINIDSNIIENCATEENYSSAAINLIGFYDIKITANTIKGCGNTNKYYGAINVAGFKYRQMEDIIIANNVITDCGCKAGYGIVNIASAKRVKIESNIIECTSGQCLRLGLNGAFVRDVLVSGNTFSSENDVIGIGDLYYTNEVKLSNNDLNKAIMNGNPYSLKKNSKNIYNEGIVAGFPPERGTFIVGEVYPTTAGLKRCTKAGTYGITTLQSMYNESVTITTTEGETSATVNAVGAIALSVGQYITIDGANAGVRIADMSIISGEEGIATSAEVRLAEAATATVENAPVTYQNPTFTAIE